MIPKLIEIPGAPWDVLPPGVHMASLYEVEAAFAVNPWRRSLFDGLVRALKLLKQAGCSKAYLDGSFVSSKPHPGDFDACWDPDGVDPDKLDQVFLDFSAGRKAQKSRFMGEFFLSSWLCGNSGPVFLKFFQTESATGLRKGIIQISLDSDSALQ